MPAHIKGLDKVVKNLNKEIIAIEGRTLKGLIRANIIIRRDMDLVPPLIPVDLENLRSSYFTVTSGGKTVEGASPNFKGKDAPGLSADHASVVSSEKVKIVSGKNPAITLGFTASYAAAVHERYGEINWQRPNSGPKFLEASIKNNKGNILKVIAEEAKIKP